MKFFNDCETIDEVKATYKTLAKIHHPDKGGDTATMQAINSEYSFAIAKIAKGENLTDAEIDSIITENEKYREAISAIINLEGINIELVGCWIWVTGNTYPVRKELKTAQFFFASKKVAWYFRTEEYKCSNKGHKQSLDEIKNKYGSTAIKTNSRPVYALA